MTARTRYENRIPHFFAGFNPLAKIGGKKLPPAARAGGQTEAAGRQRQTGKQKRRGRGRRANGDGAAEADTAAEKERRAQQETHTAAEKERRPLSRAAQIIVNIIKHSQCGKTYAASDSPAASTTVACTVKYSCA